MPTLITAVLSRLTTPRGQVPMNIAPAGTVYTLDIERMQERTVEAALPEKLMHVWVVEPAPGRWLPSILFEKKP